jgi:hypothetical protein
MNPAEVVPRGLLGRMLAEFGTEWTNLVLLTGVVISSFGLDRYLNAGIWTLGAVSTFATVYVFRRSIDARFTYYVRYSLGGVLIIVVGVLVVLGATKTDLATVFRQYRNVATLVLAIVITAPVAVCIISYKKQSVEELLELPGQLESLVTRSVLQSPICHRSVTYIIEFGEPAAGLVEVTFEVTLLPYNRSQRIQNLQDVIDPAGDNNVYLYATIRARVTSVP